MWLLEKYCKDTRRKRPGDIITVKNDTKNETKNETNNDTKNHKKEHTRTHTFFQEWVAKMRMKKIDEVGGGWE